MSRPALLLFTVLAFPAVGCGSSRLDSRDAARDTAVDAHHPADAARDAGTDRSADAARDAAPDTAFDAAVLTGRHAFDVTLTLAVMPSPSSPSSASTFPTSVRATLVLDASGGWLLIGAGGQGSTVATNAAGNGVAIASPVTLAIPFGGSCNGQATLTFATLQVAVDGGGRLRGAGAGTAVYITGDIGNSLTFTATLDGLPDATPPSLGTAGTLDPLAPARFAASEPLPPGVTAQLVDDTDGTVVDLSADAAPTFITAFRVPFMLRYGASYHAVLDQIVDFAGNQALPSQTALVTLAAPPLLTDGGFETTTGMDSLLISSTGDLPVISGMKSLYLDGGTLGSGPTVTFRLAVHPGDKVLRFSYRVAATYTSGGFYGAIVVGSPGAPIASMSTLPMGTPTTTVNRASGGTLTVGPVSSVQFTLADPNATEVVLKIAGATSGCGLPPPRAGLIVDDVLVGG